MKKIVVSVIVLLVAGVWAGAQEKYFSIDDMPDLVQCLPARKSYSIIFGLENSEPLSRSRTGNSF